MIESEAAEMVVESVKKSGLTHCPIVVLDDEIALSSVEKGQEHWSTLLDQSDTGEQFRWKALTPEEQRTEVTVLIFTSGCEKMPVPS